MSTIINADTSNGLKLTSDTSGQLELQSAGSTKVTMDTSGNVGIGTSSPGSELHVVADDVSQSWSPYDGTVLTIENNDTDGCILQTVGRNTATNEIWFGDDDSRNIGRIRYEHSDDGLEFWTNGSERMRIDSSGNVLVNATAAVGTGKFQAAFNSGFCSTMYSIGNGADYIQFWNGAERGSIKRVGGTGVSYNTSSDYRLKENVTPMSGSIDRLKQLKPSTWAWVQDGSHGEGFLAHEAQTVVPEAITGTKDAMKTEEYEVTPAVLDDEDNVVTEAVMGTREVPDYQGIDQSKLVPLLTAALQEAIQRIEALENA